MQNKIILFDSNLEKIERLLLKRGLFNFSLLYCNTFDDCVELCKGSDNAFIVCKNDQIDALVEKVKADDDNLSLVNEQAVKLENSPLFKKKIFVPEEVDVDFFLNEFFGRKDVYCCSIFGKSRNFVNEQFKVLKAEVDLDYEIITKSAFLHTVYYSKMIDEQRLKTLFGEAFYSSSDKSLTECVAQILQRANLTVSVAENLTNGALSSKLSASKAIQKSYIFFNEQNLSELGLDEEFIQLNGSVSKEAAFLMAKSLLKVGQIAVAVTGFNIDAGRCFVAVGDKESIYVFSSVFYGDDIAGTVSDFALFRLLSFLKEKYQ